ncbi:MAG: Calx-beta domain-containing protein [Isosphaeraceae bacterium]
MLRVAGVSGNGYLDPGETEEGAVDVGPFSAFPDARVMPASMNLTYDSNSLLNLGNSSIDVAYVATDTSGSGNVGLYTSLVELGSPTFGYNAIVVGDPSEVVDSGQTIPGVGQVASLSLYSPENTNGQLAFVANTASGQAVVKATRTDYTPAQIKQAYGIDAIPPFAGPGGTSVTPDGSGQTIAIVDAYNDPNILGDLSAFDAMFLLPAPPSFQIYNQSGVPITNLIGTNDSSVPGTDPDGGWEDEEAQDVEWAHAIAPGANIILVEANYGVSDVEDAVHWAETESGASVVSMSLGLMGGAEFPDEVDADQSFFSPAVGVTLVASTGDHGILSQEYPAFSPNVVAVGGTSLYLNPDGSYLTETAWQGSGGGISRYEVPASTPAGPRPTPPSYQASLGHDARTTPDVSFVADQATGVPVVNSYGKTDPSTFLETDGGGTSLSAPCWAALIAIADQGRVLAGKGPLSGRTETLPALYALPDADFHDIIDGDNGQSDAGPGNSAGRGYDLVTGRGSPVANLLVPGLVAYTSGTWSGKGSDADWSDPNNWQGGVVPSAGDALIFPAGALQTTSINDLGFGFVSVTIEDAYTFSGKPLLTSSLAVSSGSLELDCDATVSGGGTINGGAGVLAGATLVVDAGQTLDLQGGLSLAASSILVVGGTVTLESGTSLKDLGTVSIDTGGALEVGGSATIDLGGNVDAAGTLTIATGVTLTVGGSGTLTVASKGDVEVENGATLDDVGAVAVQSGAALNVDGTLTVEGSASFDDEGAVTVEGLLDDRGGIVGSITLGAGTTVKVFGILLVENGAYLGIADTVEIFPAGAFADKGSVIVEATGRLSDADAITAAAGAVLNVYGQLTEGAGGTLDDDGTLEIESGGILDIFGTVIIESGATYMPLGVVTTEPGGDLEKVMAKSATVALSTGGVTPIAGQSLTFEVLVTPPASGDPTPTGTVQFEVDGNDAGTGVSLDNGAATSGGITLTAGSHTITALYLGDATYAGAMASLTVTAVVPTATVEVTASSPLTVAGQSQTFTAAIAPSVSGAPTPTGTVQFELDGVDLGSAVALANGAATCGSVTLTAGSHTVTAVYSGDAIYAGGPGSLALSTIAPGTFAPGSLDPTFGNAGVVQLKALGGGDVAFDAQGRILVTGSGTIFRDELGLERYTADGQPDPTFGSLGTVDYGSGTGEGIAVEPDGKIVCIYADTNSDDYELVRFYDDGAIDTTFGTDGVVQLPSFTFNGITATFTVGSSSPRVAILPDGRILFAGLIVFNGTNGYGCGLAMYLPNGQLDTSFNGTGTLLTGPTDPVDGFFFKNLWNLAVDNNEILLFLSGEIPGVQSEHIRLYEFNLDGTKNTSFGTNGEVIIQDNDGQDAYYHYSYQAMALEPDGKIVVTYFNNLESDDAPGTEIFLRFNADGSPDATFGSDGSASIANFAVPYSEMFIGGSLAIQPDGKFLLIGDGGTGIVRVNSDGTLDTTFGTDGVETIPVPASLDTDLSLVAVEPSGRILALPSFNNNLLYGSVGDPVISFGAYTSLSDSSGTPTAVYDVSETAGTATITLVRGGDLSQPLSVPFSTDDSGGRGGVNYTPLNTTVTFAVGSATATVAIPILDDPNASPAVDIPLNLGAPSGGGVLGSIAVGDLHITPVEGIVIAPAQLPSVMQGGSGSSFTVVLQSVPTANVTVPLAISTTNPAAILSATSLTFTPDNALVPQTVTVTAAGGSGSSAAMATVTTGPATSADPKYNGLTGGSATVAVYPSSATSPGTIEFSAANYTVDEDAGTVTITLVRLGGSQGTVSVHFATSDDSPFASGMYNPLSGSISFGPGVTSRQLTIGLVNPGRNFHGDQTVLLTLSNPTAGATLGVYPTATLTLHDTVQTRPGDLDPAFGDQGVSFLPSGASSGSPAPTVITLQPDGKIVAAGSGGTVNGVNAVSVWRTDAVGQLDPSFGQQGLALIPFASFSQITGVGIDPDGKIVVVGTANGASHRELALLRLNADGSLDTTFGTGGLVTASVSLGDDFAQAMAIEPDGSILVAGSIGSASGAAALGLVHFNADGSLDIGFGSGGVISYPAVGSGLGAMLQQPDGKWLLVGGGGAGSLSGGGGVASGFALRLNPDFSIDTTFGTNGIASLAWGEFYTCIALQPDGKILIGGGEGPLGGGQCTIGRLNPDGSLDTSFGQGGSVAASFADQASAFNSLIVQPDGKIVGIGYTAAAGGNAGSGSYTVAARYLPDGSLDSSFAAGGSLQFAVSGDNADSPGAAIALPDGDMVVTITTDGYPVLAALLPEVPPPALPPGQHPGQLAFAVPTASLVAGSTAVFTVDRFGGSDGTVSVAYTTQDSTAVAGTDYTATSGTLTFGPGVTWQTISIPTLVDTRASGNLSLDLVLQSAGGGATLGLTDLAALTIAPAPPQAPTALTVAPVVATAGSTATFTATLTANGAPLAGEAVAFTVTAGGQTLSLGTATTGASGAATLAGVSLGSLAAGSYPGAVSASFAGDADDTPSTGSSDLTINPVSPSRQPTALAVASVAGTYGSAATFTATLTANGAPLAGEAVAFSVDIGGQTTAVGTGFTDASGVASLGGVPLTMAAAGDYPGAVSASFAGDSGDAPSTGSGDLTINPVTTPPSSTTLAVMPVVGTFGSTATFAATLTAAGAPLAGQTVMFAFTVFGQTTPLGAATTDASGVATLNGVSLGTLSAGVYPDAFSAAFAGDALDPATTAGGNLFIGQATPTITWDAPPAITQGQAIGAAQLDAAASVPGRFTYSPPAGTVLPVGSGQVLTAVFTPFDTTDFRSVSVSTTLNVVPNPGGSSLVTLTSIRGAKVRLETGRKAKKATVVVLQFSGALDPSTAQSVADYSLLAGMVKKKVLTFNKPVPFTSAIYDPVAHTVTLLPQGKRKPPKYEQLTIRSGLLTDSLGRPIDQGRTVVATVGRSGQVISQAATSAARTPSAAMVDALFAGERGFSARDTIGRFGARRSRGG